MFSHEIKSIKFSKFVTSYERTHPHIYFSQTGFSQPEGTGFVLRLASGIRYRVSGIGYQVSGIRYLN